MGDFNGKHDDPAYDSRVVEDRMGNRRYTLNTIVDKVIDQFVTETYGRDDILGELITEAQQKKLLTEVTDYVLAMDYVTLLPQEKVWLIEKVHQDLFRFGALEPYLHDPTVTEISINRYDEFFVRRGFEALSALPEIGFNHPMDLAQLLQRVLAPLGMTFEEDPFLEIGLKLLGRNMRLSFIGPPMMPFYNGQIRLHPTTPLTLDTLQDTIPPLASELLQKIVSAGHGLMIAGEVGVGKTSLVGALIPFCTKATVGLVERAREIEPSRPVHFASNPHQTFNERLAAVLEANPEAVFVDEIRGDEGQGLWALLNAPHRPQLVAAFRGKTNAQRLHSAFSMGIRKAHQTLAQSEIDHILLERLPFVAGISMVQGHPRLEFLGQWEQSDGNLKLTPLVEWHDNEISRTAHEPSRPL